MHLMKPKNGVKAKLEIKMFNLRNVYSAAKLNNKDLEKKDINQNRTMKTVIGQKFKCCVFSFRGLMKCCI